MQVMHLINFLICISLPNLHLTPSLICSTEVKTPEKEQPDLTLNL